MYLRMYVRYIRKSGPHRERSLILASRDHLCQGAVGGRVGLKCHKALIHKYIYIHIHMHIHIHIHIHMHIHIHIHIHIQTINCILVALTIYRIEQLSASGSN